MGSLVDVAITSYTAVLRIMTNNTRQINATGFIAMSSLRKVGEGSSLTTGTVQPASSRRERRCSGQSA